MWSHTALLALCVLSAYGTRSGNLYDDDDGLSAFDRTCLTETNKLRMKHEHTLSVVWDAGLATNATKWAEHLVKINKLEHSSGTEGENLYYSAATYEGSCTSAVNAWYDEISNYDFSTGKSKNGGVIGHFTQLVWKSTTNMGVGIATRKDGGYIKTYIVAMYTPPGNWRGTYTKNVMPLKSGGNTLSTMGHWCPAISGPFILMIINIILGTISFY